MRETGAKCHEAQELGRLDYKRCGQNVVFLMGRKCIKGKDLENKHTNRQYFDHKTTFF